MLPRRHKGPLVCHTDANSQTVLAKDPAQDLPEFDQASLRRDPDQHFDRGPHQPPRPGARQAHRPGSSAAFTLHQALIEPQLRFLPAGFMLDCSTWTPRHLHGRKTLLAPDRCSSARRPDHRDQQVGQARSSATPLLSDGDIMGFKSPGQSTHKPP